MRDNEKNYSYGDLVSEGTDIKVTGNGGCRLGVLLMGGSDVETFEQRPER